MREERESRDLLTIIPTVQCTQLSSYMYFLHGILMHIHVLCLCVKCKINLYILGNNFCEKNIL